jgi:hypothetical protein
MTTTTDRPVTTVTAPRSRFTESPGFLHSSFIAPADTHTERKGAVMKRPIVNINRSERVGRIVLGLVGAAAGALLLTAASGPLAIVLEVLLVLAGLDLVITGALGHCPLYKKLGHVPSSLRGSA